MPKNMLTCAHPSIHPSIHRTHLCHVHEGISTEQEPAALQLATEFKSAVRAPRLPASKLACRAAPRLVDCDRPVP